MATRTFVSFSTLQFRLLNGTIAKSVKSYSLILWFVVLPYSMLVTAFLFAIYILDKMFRIFLRILDKNHILNVPTVLLYDFSILHHTKNRVHISFDKTIFQVQEKNGICWRIFILMKIYMATLLLFNIALSRTMPSVI